MRHRFLRHSRSPARSARYNKALDRIDAYLEKTYPEAEAEKIQKVITLLFGERPEFTAFEPIPADEQQLHDNSPAPIP